MIFVASSPTASGPRPRGPAIGVLATASRASARIQAVVGVEPRSSSSRHRAGAVPVRSAAWAMASAIPVLNQT